MIDDVLLNPAFDLPTFASRIWVPTWLRSGGTWRGCVQASLTTILLNKMGLAYHWGFGRHKLGVLVGLAELLTLGHYYSTSPLRATRSLSRQYQDVTSALL